jgi:hypothetical protein
LFILHISDNKQAGELRICANGARGLLFCAANQIKLFLKIRSIKTPYIS